MKRTFSLLGLFFIGLTLLFNPMTGISATLEHEPVVVDDAALIQTTSAPPLTSSDDATAATVAPATTAAPDTPTTSTSSSTSSTTEPPATTTSEATQSVTVLGPAVNTEFGPFQVQIVVEDGVLIDIETVQQPFDRKSKAINRQVLPTYEDEAIAIQSADFDVISGATITWHAWGTSLDWALGEAGL